jgi:hypothetical protein
VIIFKLILQNHFRVDPGEKEFVDRVFEANAKKVVRDMMSNVRLQATNAFLKGQGVIVKEFWEYSSTLLITDKYTQVNDSCDHVYYFVRISY